MKTDEIMDAIGEIDLKYVQEAEEYRAENKSKGRSAAWRSYGSYKKVLPIAACLALVLGVGVSGLLYSGKEGNDADGVSGAAEGSADMVGAAVEESAKADGPASNQSADKYGAGAEESRTAGSMTETGMAGAQIYVNEITEVARTCYDIAGPVRTEYYSADALEDYYGTKIVPKTLPEDLYTLSELSEPAKSSLPHEDAAADMAADTGEAETFMSGAAEKSMTGFAVGYDDEGNVVDDNNKLRWQNKDGTRSLVIAAHTVPAREVVELKQKDLKYSRIAGCEVMLTHFRDEKEADNYLACYVKNGVTVTVESCGMTQEELLAVLGELLAEEEPYNRAE